MIKAKFYWVVFFGYDKILAVVVTIFILMEGGEFVCLI